MATAKNVNTSRRNKKFLVQNWDKGDIVVRTSYNNTRHYKILDASSDYQFLKISDEEWVNIDKIEWIGLANTRLYK